MTKYSTFRVRVIRIYSERQVLENAGVPSVAFGAFCTICRIVYQVSHLSRFVPNVAFCTNCRSPLNVALWTSSSGRYLVFAIVPVSMRYQLRKHGGFASALNESTARDRFEKTPVSDLIVFIVFDRFNRILSFLSFFVVLIGFYRFDRFLSVLPSWPLRCFFAPLKVLTKRGCGISYLKGLSNQVLWITVFIRRVILWRVRSGCREQTAYGQPGFCHCA